jgi:hypothetical protein
MRLVAVVAIAPFIVGLALAACGQISVAPSPPAPPTIAAARPDVEPAPPAVASTPRAVAPKPASAPAPAPKTASQAPAAPKTASQAPAPPKTVAPPTLDLASLEARLRATGAIGVFTKLSLKNQVKDLLDQFTTFHHGGPPPLTALRQEYDLLLLKVLSLLQNDDVSLASAVSASRESIWAILVDPSKFAKLS